MTWNGFDPEKDLNLTGLFHNFAFHANIGDNIYSFFLKTILQS